jgi:hypothetical protein
MTKRFYLLTVLLNTLFAINAQQNQYQNTAEKLINTEGNLTIGGYGEVHYNQILDKDVRHNGLLDVHRIVMFLGYNFSDKTHFVSEVEYEYAKELWVEQAYIQHKLNRFVNFQAGLMLIPMGIVNQYHEPLLFNGVERPVIDNKIAPSTWREIGVAINGNYLPLSLKYQLMLVNGPVSFDGSNGLMNGSRGIREGRQKGSKSYMSYPNFAGRVEFFGISGLNLGLSGYLGKSQSKLYDKLARDNSALVAKADSSVVGISMVGLDGRYQSGAFQARFQGYMSGLTNTDAYNLFTRKNGQLNDLGSSMYGYYVEAGYNVLPGKSESELIPFVRYQQYDTHWSVAQGITAKDQYMEHVITAGLTFRINQGVVLKTDLDFAKTGIATKYTTTLNAGVGVMF